MIWLMAVRRTHASDHDHEAPRTTSLLRVSGRRVTRQRVVICNVLSEKADRHLSAEQVAERVQQTLPGVNASTVYRTLDLLVEEGLVKRTDLGQARAYYEPVLEHSHHHLVCDECGAVTHVHDDVLGVLAARLRKKAGFELGSHELTFRGLCARCAAEE